MCKPPRCRTNPSRAQRVTRWMGGVESQSRMRCVKALWIVARGKHREFRRRRLICSQHALGDLRRVKVHEELGATRDFLVLFFEPSSTNLIPLAVPVRSHRLPRKGAEAGRRFPVAAVRQGDLVVLAYPFRIAPRTERPLSVAADKAFPRSFGVTVGPSDQGGSVSPTCQKTSPDETFATPGNLSNTMFQRFQN
jgi:hypothetical protein